MEASYEDGASGSPSETNLDAATPNDQPLQPHSQPQSLKHVVDDFSLQSQGIRFRAGTGREMRIYEQAHGQLILEEMDASDDADDDDEEQSPLDDDEERNKGNNVILVKSNVDTGYSGSFLRTTYSLMAVFVCGFLFILGFCVLLFLFINLATLLGVTKNEGVKVLDFLAVFLSVPVFVYSLSWGMTLATRFVIDTFYGHPFLRSFGIGVVATDWIAFVLYLGVPLLTFIITLFLKIDNWWEISLLAWFVSILLFWCFFSACVLWFEIWACLELMEENDRTSLIDDDPRGARIQYWMKKAVGACLRTMRYRLTGTHIDYKRVDNTNHVLDVLDRGNRFKSCINCMMSKDLASESPYSFFSNKAWNPCFVQKSPERVQTLDELLGRTHYVTRGSWSLEKLFCRSVGVNSAIPITEGESSITKAQISSNIACSLIGNVIIALLILGLVGWFDPPRAALGIILFFMLIFICCVGCSTRRLADLREDIINEDDATLYRFFEVYQRSTPKDGFIRTIIILQVLFLYFLPLIYLCTENPPSAVLFAFLGIFSAMRHCLNPRILLMEKINYFQNTVDDKTRKDKKLWKKKSRMYHIIAAGGDSARKFWTSVYLIITVFFCVVVIVAARYSEVDTEYVASTKVVSLVDGFTYEPQPYLPYPTCRLKKGFGEGDFELADFAFLSKLGYSTDDLAQKFLDQWFGPGVATNNVGLQEEFKSSDEYGYTFGSAVGYKLITFSDTNAVLTIRGTLTIWDLIADAQLWVAAMLFQGLRFLLPLSNLFTPILNSMVQIVSNLETQSITRVAFYRETTGFIKYLRDEKGFEQLEVTGHSLGGGLAIITGSQTKTNAVAFSGPNAMLSRDTFVPKLDVDELNTHTFNVIPERDPIARIDDVAMLSQNINCTAKANNFVGCHAISRTLCEIQYTCGSDERPVLCECVMDYDYPEPSRATSDVANTDQTTQKSFTQTCADICKESGWDDEKCQRWKEKASK